MEITPASDADYDVIVALARFYIYDMAEHAGWAFPDSGGFEAGHQFANYWGKPGAPRPWPPEWKGFPFLVRLDGHPAGFALVKQIGAGSFDMGEFYIGRQHRRRALGQQVATALFDKFPGQWEVREMLTNIAAQAFWRRIIADYTNGDFTDGREAFPAYGNAEFTVQRFRSGATPRD
ncbi:MAG TPA: GNAT family N-acetyltransferase [Rhizomicrobium sp.]